MKKLESGKPALKAVSDACMPSGHRAGQEISELVEEIWFTAQLNLWPEALVLTVGQSMFFCRWQYIWHMYDFCLLLMPQ